MYSSTYTKIPSLVSKDFTCFINLVPSGPPTSVTRELLPSSSVHVRWQPPQLSERNGIISGYTVRLTALQDGSITEYNLQGTASSQQIEGMISIAILI